MPTLNTMASFKLLICLVIFSIYNSVQGCGYQSCPQSYDSKKIQLHIIAHSHDDVGWGKTPDGYFDEDVTHVITNVLASLQKNAKRKFVQVEMYYFRRWWYRQTSATQDIVKNLVRSGQFTFANGGWCVNDEAVTHYSAIIDQMTLGIQFLRDTFGECAEPKLSWQIDPFGASREMANLFAQMGFDAHVVNRGDNLYGEFLWNTSESHSIFTTHLHNHYSAPNGFNFEDADEITEQNKHDKANTLVELGKQWNKDYGNKGHVLITFGDDFRYKNAERYFSNLDKLIEVVNSDHPDVNLFYSSPICYIKAIQDLKPKLETKSRDYFPLWTGFFTSRPQVKYLERFANNLLQAAKQLEVLANLPHTQGVLFEAKNEQAVLQHHDAITGTSPAGPNKDFKKRMINAMKASKNVIGQAIEKLRKKNDASSKDQTDASYPLVYTTVNISDFGNDQFQSDDAFAIIIYNPLVHEQRNVWIRIPVNQDYEYKLYDWQEKEVTQLSKVAINQKVKQLIGHHQDITHELVFNANQLPALGFTTYIAIKEKGKKLIENKQSVTTDAQQNYVLQGKNFQLIIDHKNGNVKQLIRDGKQHRFEQMFMYYQSNTTSVYEFCAINDVAIDLTNNESSTVVSAGKYENFFEVTQKVNDWIWQTVRVYEDKEYVEFDWVVGPISDADHMGKNVITRFVTDLETDSTFYTDANGRQNIRRQRNDAIRDCAGSKNRVSYNFYPITSRAFIQDDRTNLVMSVLTDHSVGASSMKNGQLELMIHRREFGYSWIPLNDIDIDGKGVVARGKNFVFFSNKQEAADNYRQLSQSLYMQPIVAFDPTNSVTKYRQENQLQFSALKSSLPGNIHLLTLENWGAHRNNELLVRFENFYQSDDQTKLAKIPTIPLDIFTGVQIKEIFISNLVVGARKSISATNNHINLAPQEIHNFVYKVKRPDNNACNLSWKKLINRALPANAVVAGYDNNNNDKNSKLYICRHKDGDLIPGKFSEILRCHVGYGGKEVRFDDNDVEILIAASGDNDNYQWAPRHGGDSVPENAYKAGETMFGLPIYIGRCTIHGEQVGKIDEYFFYPYGEQEREDCVDHEILTC